VRCAKIGSAVASPQLRVFATRNAPPLIDIPLDTLESAWRSPLAW
jgi:hypothetical protein